MTKKRIPLIRKKRKMRKTLEKGENGRNCQGKSTKKKTQRFLPIIPIMRVVLMLVDVDHDHVLHHRLVIQKWDEAVPARVVGARIHVHGLLHLHLADVRLLHPADPLHPADLHGEGDKK